MVIGVSALFGRLYANVLTVKLSGVFSLASFPVIFEIATGFNHATLGIVSFLMKFFDKRPL